MRFLLVLLLAPPRLRLGLSLGCGGGLLGVLGGVVCRTQRSDEVGPLRLGCRQRRIALLQPLLKLPHRRLCA